MNMETEPGDKEELQVSPESPLNPEDRAEATSSPTDSVFREETNLLAESFEKEDTHIPSESLDKEETNLQCSVFSRFIVCILLYYLLYYLCCFRA